MNNMENHWSELVTTFWIRSDDVNIGDVVVVLELIHIYVSMEIWDRNGVINVVASKWTFLIEHPSASNSFLKHVKLWSAFYHHRLHNIPSNEFQNMVKPGIVEGH